MYNMTYSGVVSSVPFLVIIIVFAPVRTTDQIWWCPFQIPHLCEILHLLTCKSYVEHVIRLPSINLHYFNLLFIGYPKALLMVTSSIIQYSKTLLWHWIHTYTCVPISQIRLVHSLNWHHSWIHIENQCWIHIHMYQFPELPNLVSSITKLMLQLDPHWKSVLNAYTYVPIPKIPKFG